jgi:hypothetical protein
VTVIIHQGGIPWSRAPLAIGNVQRPGSSGGSGPVTCEAALGSFRTRARVHLGALVPSCLLKGLVPAWRGTLNR